MAKTVIAKGAHPHANFNKYRYYFRKDGYLRAVDRSTKQTRVLKSIKLPERWQPGYFYVLNGKGDIVRSEMAAPF